LGGEERESKRRKGKAVRGITKKTMRTSKTPATSHKTCQVYKKFLLPVSEGKTWVKGA